MVSDDVECESVATGVPIEYVDPVTQGQYPNFRRPQRPNWNSIPPSPEPSPTPLNEYTDYQRNRTHPLFPVASTPSPPPLTPPLTPPGTLATNSPTATVANGNYHHQPSVCCRLPEFSVFTHIIFGFLLCVGLFVSVGFAITGFVGDAHFSNSLCTVREQAWDITCQQAADGFWYSSETSVLMGDETINLVNTPQPTELVPDTTCTEGAVVANHLVSDDVPCLPYCTHWCKSRVERWKSTVSAYGKTCCEAVQFASNNTCACTLSGHSDVIPFENNSQTGDGHYSAQYEIVISEEPPKSLQLDWYCMNGTSTPYPSHDLCRYDKWVSLSALVTPFDCSLNTAKTKGGFLKDNSCIFGISQSSTSPVRGAILLSLSFVLFVVGVWNLTIIKRK